MAKGAVNPLTPVVEKALAITEERWNALAATYGLPLFVTEGGKNELLKWPDNPDTMTPEEMQVLISTRGEQAVNQWLAEFYASAGEKSLVSKVGR